ncbi:translocation/assembly module TamB domain-containing protein [Tritonibacter multivorans]|uniref:translocation/assembly module TamB domain-containing protein n=1 Tax=Tritonibacter multivorans TaxID=928856 RepID=UPI00071C7AF6|nr:translocation/assembly module TamB domain-containing protein [Tritonibacter multivorans]MDA7419534.1 translocation/assembly module TamB domain-containing protein [Tritonibacter multivorans]
MCTLFAAINARPVLAQDGDGSFLERFLEDSLSSDNQQVRVTGLRGALSSRATIEELAFLDQDGTWLTLKDAVLDWNRTALLRGRFVVNALSAARIDVLRSPGQPAGVQELPSPETKPFSLPELPVSVEIAKLEVGVLTLAKDLIGTAATLTASGNLSLVSGTADVALLVERLDRDVAGPDPDRLDLKAGFSNETEVLTLDLLFAEAPGGLVSAALSLPGKPDLDLALTGSGPLSKFRADLTLDSEGQRRLEGAVVLAEPQDSPGVRQFDADLTGDIDAFLPQAYHAFFGPGLRAQLRGQQGPDALVIDELSLASRALQLNGALTLADGVLDTVDLVAAISPPDGAARVVLPVPGGDTSLAAMTLRLTKPQGADWQVTAALQELQSGDIFLRSAQIQGDGILPDGPERALAGRVRATLRGLDPGDPALAKALGTTLSLSTDIAAGGTDAETLSFSDLELDAGGATAQGALSLSGLSEGLKLAANLSVLAPDLSRFDALVGQPVKGALTGDLTGTYTALESGFDLSLSANGQDLGLGNAQLDPLTAGASTLVLSAARDSSGLRIDDFALQTAEITAKASGNLDSKAGQLGVSAQLAQINRLVPQLEGPATVTANLRRKGDAVLGTADIVAATDITLALSGQVARDGTADFDFDARLPRAERFAAQLRGAPVVAKGNINRKDGQIAGAGMVTGPAGLDLSLNGEFEEATGAADLSYRLLIARLETLLPGLDGALRSEGEAKRADAIWQVDGNARGPLGIDMRFGGQWDEGEGLADLASQGSLRLEGANSFLKPRLIEGPLTFDLTLKGTPELSNLSGRLATRDSRLVLPDLAQQIEGITGQIDLAAGRAALSLSARPREGGTLRIAGPVTLSEPYSGALDIQLSDIVLTDKLSYETILDGQMRLGGPLAAGARLDGVINVGETNLNLNTAGGSISAAPIPPIRLTGATAAQRATRIRAGLADPSVAQDTSDTGGPAIALNLTINAPRKIFARGRGLNAELGGSIAVRGTTANLAPAGQISLIRGTFDILGRRLNLDEGQVTLLGDLTPYLEFRSSAQTEQGTATLELSGRADAPRIQVTSDPARPSEEALALLLFGDNIQDLSPLALARLASSVLTLSGRGGGANKELRDATGVDSVDIGADNLGTGQLGLGGYLADNVYTDFNINTEGDSELTINLDLSRTLTATGTVTGEGETGLGLFFKRDY